MPLRIETAAEVEERLRQQRQGAGQQAPRGTAARPWTGTSPEARDWQRERGRPASAQTVDRSQPGRLRRAGRATGRAARGVGARLGPAAVLGGHLVNPDDSQLRRTGEDLGEALAATRTGDFSELRDPESLLGRVGAAIGRAAASLRPEARRMQGRLAEAEVGERERLALRREQGRPVAEPEPQEREQLTGVETAGHVPGVTDALDGRSMRRIETESGGRAEIEGPTDMLRRPESERGGFGVMQAFDPEAERNITNMRARTNLLRQVAEGSISREDADRVTMLNEMEPAERTQYLRRERLERAAQRPGTSFRDAQARRVANRALRRMDQQQELTQQDTQAQRALDIQERQLELESAQAQGASFSDQLALMRHQLDTSRFADQQERQDFDRMQGMLDRATEIPWGRRAGEQDTERRQRVEAFINATGASPNDPQAVQEQVRLYDLLEHMDETAERASGMWVLGWGAGRMPTAERAQEAVADLGEAIDTLRRARQTRRGASFSLTENDVITYRGQDIRLGDMDSQARQRLQEFAQREDMFDRPDFQTRGRTVRSLRDRD